MCNIVMASGRSIAFNNTMCIIMLVILFLVSLNVAKGDLEDWRIKVLKGDKGECTTKFQIETITETCIHKKPCLEGPPGQQGYKGQKGDKGQMGDTGEKGKCEEIGTLENPATSCVDSHKNDNPYIFRPSPFKVNCDYLNNRICFNTTRDLIKIDELYKRTKEEPYWLWHDASKKHIFEQFYELKKTQISHLVSISNRVTLNIIFHCMNFELRDNVKILLWDNNLIGQTASFTSPDTYTVPEDQNGCQNFLDPDEWRTAIIFIETTSGPAKNFFIPAKTSENQGLYFQFLNICFYF